MTEQNSKSSLSGRISEVRTSGILLHISSLPSQYGIGDLGLGSHAFIDFLARSGQSYWQVLPLVPVSPAFGNSPYMSGSAFAGNTLLISPDLLIRDGWLRQEELPSLPAEFSEYLVHFEAVAAWKEQVLARAWQSFQNKNDGVQQETFFNELTNRLPWLRNYSLFTALKQQFNQQGWFDWPEELRQHQPEAIEAAEQEFQQNIRRCQFEQYLFFQQWQELHRHAAANRVQIIGDLPIYVALDSADVWADQDIFMLSPKTGHPTHVAGVPPDYFSKTGQLWGNPLYRWHSRTAEVKQRLLDWWEERLRAILSVVDVIRIDHFRGFEAYWSVAAKEETAMNGSWQKGPGLRFFKEMEKRLGSLPVIAEDLGVITQEVEALRDDLGFPGMKILLFAFDGKSDNAYLPQNMITNCVVYTGTHDNDTAVGWYLSGEVAASAKQQAKHCANRSDDDTSRFHEDMIYLAQSSVAALCLLPMQDVLGFGNDCRMNTPGTASGNWRWRCASRFITDALAEQLRQSTILFGRLPATEAAIS
ncbi:MAG: 4-alpha-glucanotransferase [Candidatus Electronema aureum]|uniref:4-alpha-glucanotransferase n=1 Tax=Candidatus Electronema aureum TaxID=2005002 RepID=A0A521G1A9_9BACT|nr:MAG: 4-alpha-glucanotransferase [Candidatus Electronema aureum]